MPTAGTQELIGCCLAFAPPPLVSIWGLPAPKSLEPPCSLVLLWSPGHLPDTAPTLRYAAPTLKSRLAYRTHPFLLCNASPIIERACFVPLHPLKHRNSSWNSSASSCTSPPSTPSFFCLPALDDPCYPRLLHSLLVVCYCFYVVLCGSLPPKLRIQFVRAALSLFRTLYQSP